MKRAQLKKILKPIVKEMVEDALEEIILEEGYINRKLQEMIFEGNLIKGVVKQAVSGLAESQQNYNPAPVQQVQQQQPIQEQQSSTSNAALREKMKRNLGLSGGGGPSRMTVKQSPMVSKLMKNEKVGKMFEGTAPLQDGGSGAILSDGTPNYRDPLSVAASIPDPELGGPVDENTLNALLGGKKFNIK